MFVSTYPKFVSGRILKLDMLEALRDFPKDVSEILVLNNKTDGIVTGCDIIVKDNEIVIGKGIIMLDKVLFWSKKEIKIKYTPTNEVVILKIKKRECGGETDFESYTAEIRLDEEKLCDKEIELCRFRLNKGSKLRYEYMDFKDFGTEYDTIIKIHAAYSGKYKPGICTELLKRYGQETISHNPQNPLDNAFSVACMMDGNAVGRDMVISYIRNRSYNISEDCTNEEIYNGLLDILNEIKHGNSIKKDTYMSGRRILLD